MWICTNGNNLFLTKKIQAYQNLVIYFSNIGIVPEEKQKNLYT